MLKYIGKTGERITYSRGLATEIIKTISSDDIVAEMLCDFVAKYVLFDDVIDYDTDIAHTRCEQMTFSELSRRRC